MKEMEPAAQKLQDYPLTPKDVNLRALISFLSDAQRESAERSCQESRSSGDSSPRSDQAFFSSRKVNPPLVSGKIHALLDLSVKFRQRQKLLLNCRTDRMRGRPVCRFLSVSRGSIKLSTEHSAHGGAGASGLNLQPNNSSVWNQKP